MENPNDLLLIVQRLKDYAEVNLGIKDFSNYAIVVPKLPDVEIGDKIFKFRTILGIEIVVDPKCPAPILMEKEKLT